MVCLSERSGFRTGAIVAQHSESWSPRVRPASIKASRAIFFEIDSPKNFWPEIEMFSDTEGGNSGAAGACLKHFSAVNKQTH